MPFSSTGPISVNTHVSRIRGFHDILTDQHLSGPRILTDPRCDIHRLTEVVASLEDDGPIREEGADRPSDGIGRARGPKVVKARGKIVVAEDLSIGSFDRG